MKEQSYSDAQIINWLSDCDSIDRNGQDGGWAFNRCVMTDGEKNVGVADIRIATRGFEGVDGLRKQAMVAMDMDKTMGENPWLKSAKKK